MKRYLIAVCVVAGCYKPSTESCYYACATQGAPCPSGLSCVAGMCAAPGDDCSAIGDGGLDSSIDALGDAAPLICGDGIAAIGEVCFGTPLPFVPPGNPSFAQLGDRDGDGDLDLIYVDQTSYRFHINNAGSLTGVSVAGPQVADTPAMVLANLTPNANIELLNTQPGTIQGYSALGTASYTFLFSHPSTQFPQGNAMAFGPITTSPIGALAVVHGGNILVVYRFDTPADLTLLSSHATSGARRVTLAKLNADAFADVVLATDNGLVVHLASSTNLGTPMQVGPTTRIENAVAGDFNGDGQGDIVFNTVSATTGLGTINILPGRGNGSFNPGSGTQITGLGAALAVADIDRDGRDDAIAFVGGSAPAVLIFRGKPDGSLDAPTMLPVTGTSSHLSARGDFNGDMVPDIVLTDFVGRRVLVIPSRP